MVESQQGSGSYPVLLTKFHMYDYTWCMELLYAWCMELMELREQVYSLDVKMVNMGQLRERERYMSKALCYLFLYLRTFIEP